RVQQAERAAARPPSGQEVVKTPKLSFRWWRRSCRHQLVEDVAWVASHQPVGDDADFGPGEIHRGVTRRLARGRRQNVEALLKGGSGLIPRIAEMPYIGRSAVFRVVPDAEGDPDRLRSATLQTGS